MKGNKSMANYGQTANGVAHFAPMMRLEAPQINIRNPFNDLIAIAMKEREMELKENELGLKEKGLGLDEQVLAYNAANDETNRQHAIELEMLKGKNAKDKANLDFSLKKSEWNRLKAEKKLEDDKVEEVRSFIRGVHTDRVKSGENISVLQTFKDIEDFARARFGNNYVDEAFGRESGLKNFRDIQSGSGTGKGTRQRGF
jgi:hypothetical protein